MLALTDPVPTMEPDDELAAWAASGAMWLTGRPDREPLGPPAGFVTRMRALGAELAGAAAALGGRLEIDPLRLLGERAAIAGLHRRGATSAGGATRLLSAADGWIAVSLARPDDVALVPAWLELDGPVGDPWAAIEREVAARASGALVERARLVGLPAAVLGERASQRAAVVPTELGAAPRVASLANVTVVELGSLWAGPLCGSLLQEAGATVVKVESTTRPDGARRGPPAFFDLLNAGKRSVGLDLSTSDGPRALRDLVVRADVVIEASRPRALEQLGIEAAAMTSGEGPRAWVSITGYGREAPEREWVAFGDDAAVAGGLVARDADGPVFCADAVADPITGMVAAASALRSLATDRRRLLDVALSEVAASLAGPTLPVERPVQALPPQARSAKGSGPPLGESPTGGSGR